MKYVSIPSFCVKRKKREGPQNALGVQEGGGAGTAAIINSFLIRNLLIKLLKIETFHFSGK